MTSRRKKIVLPMALAGAALVVLAVASLASAGHVVPKGASPMRISFVPAYKVCAVGAANNVHGSPLAAPSCAPPVLESGSLTTGTPDNNGAPAKMNASGKLVVVLGSPNDVSITLSVNDVRCQAGTLAANCATTNTTGPPDYGDADVLADDLQATATIRITDHDNGSPGPGGTTPATVLDLPFPVGIDCATTADVTIGGLCTRTTSANAVVPGSVKTGKRGIVEISQFVVNDGGDDADITTNTVPPTPPTAATNTVFLRQGIFIP